jgi:hypothetical protein
MDKMDEQLELMYSIIKLKQLQCEKDTIMKIVDKIYNV